MSPVCDLNMVFHLSKILIFHFVLIEVHRIVDGDPTMNVT